MNINRITPQTEKCRAVVINADCGATTNGQTQIFVEKLDGSKKQVMLFGLIGTLRISILLVPG